MKKCPYCAEEIQDEAIKCKHCGEFLNVNLDANSEEEILEKSIYYIRGYKKNDSNWSPSLSKNIFTNSKESAETIAINLIKGKNEEVADYDVKIFRPNLAKNKLCVNCKNIVIPQYEKPGSGCITILLLFIMVIPAIIYAIWRKTSTYLVCSVCGSGNLINIDSPAAKKIFNDTLRLDQKYCKPTNEVIKNNDDCAEAKPYSLEMSKDDIKKAIIVTVIILFLLFVIAWVYVKTDYIQPFIDKFNTSDIESVKE